jgi:excisionase family DNA binding protein
MTKRKDIPPVEYVTTTEAAALLGITRYSVNRLITAGTFEGRKVNNRLWLVNRASLANWTPKRKHREKPIE